MPAVKKYTRINFQNYPSTSTPLNATNLNKMDKGIDDLDDELVTVKNAIENMSFDADAISYDNTQSGLQATDVQGAVDEINDNLTASNQTAGITNVPFRFGCTDDGKFGYIINQGGADSVIPFSNSAVEIVDGTISGNTIIFTKPSGFKPKYVEIIVDGYCSGYYTQEHFTVVSDSNIINSNRVHSYHNASQVNGTDSCLLSTIYMIEVKPGITSIVLQRTTSASANWWTKKATFIS